MSGKEGMGGHVFVSLSVHCVCCGFCTLYEPSQSEKLMICLPINVKKVNSMYQGWHLADILLFSYIFLRLLIGKKATGLTFLFQGL